MTKVGSYEAKTHLPGLLERVAKGECITITKHGVPVAVMIPASHQSRPVKQVIAELYQFRSRHTLEGISVREMIEEGRP